MSPHSFSNPVVGTQQEAVDFFKSILDASTEYSIIGKDLHGNIVLWNEGARRIYGYTSEEVVGKVHGAILHTPEDIAAGKPHEILEVAKREGKWEGTLSRLRKNGELFTAHAIVTPRRDAQGQVTGFLLISKDISEEMRLGAEQRRSAGQMAELVKAAMDAIVTIDAEQRIVLFNPAAEQVFGYSSDEVLGQSIERLLPQRFRAAHSEHIHNFEQTGATSRKMGALDAISGLRSNGEEFPIEASISQVEVAGQKLSTVILRDISERKRAEEALRASENRLRTIIETEPECVKVVSREGHLLEMNLAGLAMLEADSLAQVQQTSLLELIAPEHRAAFGELHRRVMAGESGTVQFEVIGLKGSRRWLETHATPLRDGAGQSQSLLGITRDITGRKRAEAALVETQEHLQLALHSAQVGLWDWNIQTSEIYYSPEWKSQLGYKEHEIRNDFSEWERLTHPDDLITTLDTVKRYLAAPWPDYRVEFRMCHKNGSWRWILAQASLFHDAQGQPLRMLGAHIDITERKEAEAALRRQADLLEQSYDAIFVWEVGGTISYWNRGAELLYGFTNEEAIGQTSHQLLQTKHPLTIQQFEDELTHAGSWEGELRHTTKDGRQITIESRHVVVRQEGGHINVMETNRDITSRKEAVESLKAREGQLSLIFENVYDILFVVAVAPDEEFHFASVNRRFLEATGLSANQIVGQRVTDIIPPSAHALVLKNYREAIRTAQPVSWEEVSLYPSGRKCGVVTVAPVFDEQGQCNQLIGTVHDITERQQAAEELAAVARQMRALAQRLEAVQEEQRGNIARELHDDLGQTLSAMKMNLSVLLREATALGAATDTALRGRIEPLQQLVDGSLQSVRRICLELRPRVLDDLGLAAAIEWQVGEFKKHTGIRCRLVSEIEGIKFESQRSVTVFRILQEALSNIARHAGATRVEVRVCQKKEQFILEVRDNGKGIRPEDMVKTTSLGLLGIRERVFLLDGDVVIEGNPGKGTKVRVQIPLQTAKNDGIT